MTRDEIQVGMHLWKFLPRMPSAMRPQDLYFKCEVVKVCQKFVRIKINGKITNAPPQGLVNQIPDGAWEEE